MAVIVHIVSAPSHASVLHSIPALGSHVTCHSSVHIYKKCNIPLERFNTFVRELLLCWRASQALTPELQRAFFSCCSQDQQANILNSIDLSQGLFQKTAFWHIAQLQDMHIMSYLLGVLVLFIHVYINITLHSLSDQMVCCHPSQGHSYNFTIIINPYFDGL
jgi:hypothetical protein